MKFITLTLTEGETLLVDKTLISYAIQYGSITTLTLSNTKQLHIKETPEQLKAILEPELDFNSEQY